MHKINFLYIFKVNSTFTIHKKLEALKRSIKNSVLWYKKNYMYKKPLYTIT